MQADEVSYALLQFVLPLTVFGRWCMPKQGLTSEAFSSLLEVAVAMAFDIAEFTHLIVDEPDLHKDRPLLILVLVFTSTSILLLVQIDVGLASDEKKSKIIWTLMTIFLLDGPFFCIRIYIAANFTAEDLQLVFLLKNMFGVIFCGYHIFSLLCTRDQESKTELEETTVNESEDHAIEMYANITEDTDEANSKENQFGDIAYHGHVPHDSDGLVIHNKAADAIDAKVTMGDDRHTVNDRTNISGNVNDPMHVPYMHDADRLLIPTEAAEVLNADLNNKDNDKHTVNNTTAINGDVDEAKSRKAEPGDIVPYHDHVLHDSDGLVIPNATAEVLNAEVRHKDDEGYTVNKKTAISGDVNKANSRENKPEDIVSNHSHTRVPHDSDGLVIPNQAAEVLNTEVNHKDDERHAVNNRTTTSEDVVEANSRNVTNHDHMHVSHDKGLVIPNEAAISLNAEDYHKDDDRPDTALRTKDHHKSGDKHAVNNTTVISGDIDEANSRENKAGEIVTTHDHVPHDGDGLVVPNEAHEAIGAGVHQKDDERPKVSVNGEAKVHQHHEILHQEQYLQDDFLSSYIIANKGGVSTDCNTSCKDDKAQISYRSDQGQHSNISAGNHGTDNHEDDK
jgi:hypothetical protein